jgi:hypothetical protein
VFDGCLSELVNEPGVRVKLVYKIALLRAQHQFGIDSYAHGKSRKGSPSTVRRWPRQKLVRAALMAIQAEHLVHWSSAGSCDL